MLITSSYFELVRKTLNRKRPARVIRRSTALLLLASLVVCSLPTAVAATAVRSGIVLSTNLASRTEEGLKTWIGSLKPFRRSQRRGMPEAPVNSPGVKPAPPLSKEDKEARVASIQMNTAEDVVLESRQPMLFSAIPIDGQGVTIHGLQAEWESSDRQIVFVKKNGEAVAGKPGSAILSASAGRAKDTVRVTVIAGTNEKFGGKKKENSRRHGNRAGENTSNTAVAQVVRRPEQKRQHAQPVHSAYQTRFNSLLGATLPMSRDPMDDPLPDDETGSLYTPANSVGSPPGKKTPGALAAATATDGTETPTSQNFMFGVPITSLPGRGIDVSLNLAYNSRTFNKSVDPFDGSTWMTYDVDSGWPAAGFRLGYGQIEDQGFFGFTLTDADGTRHALVYTSPNNYDTDDGTFIHFTGGRGWGSLFYADGTRVDYGAAGGGFRSYPTRIVDRNGNFILISYVAGIGPKISSIQDTLGRFVRFYYAANGDLVTITAPGLSGQPDRQVIRFYYQDIIVNQPDLFQPTINVSAPATARVIKFIYFPNRTESGNAHVGYRYDYTAYGMMRQIAELRGMTVDSGALDQTGWIASEGLQAALTTYNYPITPSNLADVPAYTRRTDEWAGRTTGMPGTDEAPYYTFSVDKPNGISTVTAPDNTVTETHTIVAPGQWNDGLLSQTLVKQGTGGPVLARTDTSWEQDANGRNPRPQQLQMTNDVGQTTTVVLTYSSYNNVIVTSTRGFDGAEVRRVETDYQTNAAWTSRHLLHLPISTRVYAGGSATPASRVDYAYDTAGINLTPRNDIIMHDPAYDPFQATQENCEWVCYQYDQWWVNCIDWQWVCTYYNPYDPATDFRGNVTSVTNYTDAATGAGAITNTATYDIAGNVITAQVDCCQQKSFTYSNSYFYAYPTSLTSGAGPTLSMSVSYDFNTGVVADKTDENGQVTYFHYHADSLRPEHVDYPAGATVSYHYDDNLQTDAVGRRHFYASTSIKLDATRSVDSYRFFDGRGAVTQTFDNFTQANGWSTQDTEYDEMGRAYRTGNPYYSAGYASVGINPTGLWTTRTFDNLGRVTRVDMPSGDAQNPTATYATAEYAGVFTTITDQAGKQRRQKSDALGHVVRVDEPDGNGDLGPTETPTRHTTYEYDVLDNLIHIVQESQHRYFKFDSLSRLTYERQVEQEAPYTTEDSVAGNNQWSRKISYDSQGQVRDAYDARQMRTQFVYDGLNRVKEVHYFRSDGSTDPATPSAFYYYDSQALPAGAPTFDRGYATGRLVAVTYGSSTSTTGNYLGYDQIGRVVRQRQVTGANTYALSYGYNLGGLLTSETYPSGRSVSYAYDEGAKLSQVSDGTSTYASGFSYEPHGGLSTETFGNGAVHSMAYNRSLQASEIKLKQSANGAELQRFNYFYGTVNQANGSVDTTKNNGQIGRLESYSNGAKQWDQRFSYDSLGRLSTAAEYQQGNNNQLTWQTQYTFDRYGNRFQAANSTLGLQAITASEINATTNRFLASGSTPTTYDAAGNITIDTKFRGMNYSYDANGRMTFAEHIDHSNQQTSVYDCAGQRVQTIAGSVTRTIVYDIFGKDVAEYLGSGTTLERENIYRAGQLLATFETGATSAPTGLMATADSSITLNWSAASSATNYRVERKGAGGAYSFLGATSSTILTDSGASLGSAYLYRVCAADGANNCTSNYSNIVLGARLNFATDPVITTAGNDPSGQTVTQMKAAHITELRTAVNAVRSLAALSPATWTHPTLTPHVTEISKDDVNELRMRLDEALVVLGVRTSLWIDHPLAGAPNGTLIRGVHITQLRQCSTSGSSCKPIEQFVRDFYEGALHRPPSQSELSTWTATLGQAQTQGPAQLLAAAQSLGSTLFNSAEYAGRGTSNAVFLADLYHSFLQRTHDLEGYDYWLGILNSENDRAHLILAFAVSAEFGSNVSAICAGPATGGELRYLLADLQGSARAAMNNTGVGTSAIIARHDYLPFGEEIGSGLGLRAASQGFGAIDTNRWKYGLTERNSTTGLDHTWWRKYENLSGRWTSPDPYLGSMSIGDPQSTNRYAYVQNDPVNFIDPTGLDLIDEPHWTDFCFSAAYHGCGSGNQMAAFADAFMTFMTFGPAFWDLPGNNNEAARGEFLYEVGMYIPHEAHYIGAFSWGWTDLSHEPFPSYTYSFREERLRNLIYWGGTFAFDNGGVIRDVYGRIIGERGLDMHPVIDPVWIVAGLASGIVRSGMRGAAAGGAARQVTLQTEHIMGHFVGTGLTEAQVNFALRQAVQVATRGATSTGSFWGRVSIRGVLIEYRAFTLPNGVVNIGTAYPWPK
jgi:RHS repeat-associated protein